MTALRAQDFPSLQARPNTNDDFAAIFEANLALTQLFSNAHDVLYATKDRSNQLNFGGEYVKYATSKGKSRLIRVYSTLRL